MIHHSNGLTRHYYLRYELGKEASIHEWQGRTVFRRLKPVDSPLGTVLAWCRENELVLEAVYRENDSGLREFRFGKMPDDSLSLSGTPIVCCMRVTP